MSVNTEIVTVDGDWELEVEFEYEDGNYTILQVSPIGSGCVLYTIPSWMANDITVALEGLKSYRDSE